MLDLLFLVTLAILLVIVRSCTCKLGWTGAQDDPLTMWRMYAMAGFTPEEPLWNMDEGGSFMYVPGLPLSVLPKYRKLRAKRRAHRRAFQKKFIEKQGLIDGYLDQLDRILREYYGVPNPQPMLQKYFHLQPAWDYFGLPPKTDLGDSISTVNQ